MPRMIKTGSRPVLSRRALLRLSGGGALLAAGGAVAFAAPSSYVRGLLARTLPGVTLDPDGVALFEEELFRVRFSDPTFQAMAWGLGPASWVDPIAPAAVRALREEFDRRAMTFFFDGSDFFAVEDPQRETVTYFGAPAMCAGNPFAVFDLEDPDEPDGRAPVAVLGSGVSVTAGRTL